MTIAQTPRLLIRCAASLWLAIGLAGPGPWGIALNLQSLACTSYWPGDEYMYYRLPAGWQAYYPDDQGVISIGGRSCNYYQDGAKECCRQLGYAFVDQDITSHRPTEYFLILLVFKYWYIPPAIFLLVFLYRRHTKARANPS